MVISAANGNTGSRRVPLLSDILLEVKGGRMKGISVEFVQEFRQRRKEKDWDLWQLRQWMRREEARLEEENPGLYDYITAILAGLGDRLEAPLRSLVCDRLYFHFLELLAIIYEHEQIEAFEKLWERHW
jgi:hypothetical protein